MPPSPRRVASAYLRDAGFRHDTDPGYHYVKKQLVPELHDYLVGVLDPAKYAVLRGGGWSGGAYVVVKSAIADHLQHEKDSEGKWKYVSAALHFEYTGDHDGYKRTDPTRLSIFGHKSDYTDDINRDVFVPLEERKRHYDRLLRERAAEWERGLAYRKHAEALRVQLYEFIDKWEKSRSKSPSLSKALARAKELIEEIGSQRRTAVPSQLEREVQELLSEDPRKVEMVAPVVKRKVDGPTSAKMEILQRLREKSVGSTDVLSLVDGALGILSVGGDLDGDQLRALRHRMYQAGMRTEADHFRGSIS